MSSLSSIRNRRNVSTTTRSGCDLRTEGLLLQLTFHQVLICKHQEIHLRSGARAYSLPMLVPGDLVQSEFDTVATFLAKSLCVLYRLTKINSANRNPMRSYLSRIKDAEGHRHRFGIKFAVRRG